MRSVTCLLVLVLVLVLACEPARDLVFPGDAGTDSMAGGSGFSSTRSVSDWPFASDSIWNAPIGRNAVYVPAHLTAPSIAGLGAAEAIIILHPEAPVLSVFQNDSGWSGADRCPATGALHFDAPIPPDFLVPSGPGTPSFPLAALLADGRTLKQSQPFARCTAGQPATTLFDYPDADLWGDGLAGANGGSGLSSLGGVLRLGELRPNSAPIRHALHIELSGKENLHACTVASDCFRWPASQADAFAVSGYGGNVAELKMGALLALPGTLDLASLALSTAPASQLAWTLQNYGCYVANDSGESLFNVGVERGPDGAFVDQFFTDYGFAFSDPTLESPWASDMRKIFLALSVVDDNSPTTIGGSGPRRQPLAPAIGP